MKELMEHGLNEFILMVFNTEKIYKYYVEILKDDKLSGQKFTAENFYNCLKNHFYQDFYANRITRNLLAFNGDITQYETFKEFEEHIKDDRENIEKWG